MNNATKKAVSLFLSFVIAFSMITLGIGQIDSNALSYDGTSSYMSGKYFTSLCNVQLTGNQVDDIVNIAISQIGYKSGSSNYDLSGQTSSTSNVKYSEYGYMIGSNPNDWCAYFVSWCARRANISSSVLPNFAGCTPAYNKDLPGDRHSRSSGYIPKKGDIIFFGTSSSNIYHVGIVKTDSDGYNVKYIDGNNTSTTPHCVNDSVSSLSNTNIWGYVTPDYSNTAPIYSEPPTTPTVTVDQRIALINDDITISFSAERVHRYWIGIYKDGVLFNDYSIYNSNSITVDYPWVGKYDFVVVAINNCGDASAYGSFYVGRDGDYVPDNFTVSCNKSTVMKNETVALSFSANYATAYWVGIYHNDEWILRDNYTTNSFTVNYSNPGEYSVAIVAMNPCSSSDTKYIKFTVLDVESPPTSPSVTVDKTVNLANESITISFDSFGAEDYWVGIYKDNVLFNDYVTTDKQIIVDYPWVGKYDIAVVARNSYGSTGGYASFYVGKEGDYVPSNFTVKGNKTLALKNEAVTLTYSADYATAYWVGIYHNNDWILRDNFIDNSITVNYSDPGEYSVAIVAMNPCSSSETKYYKFTVVEQKTFPIQYDANGGFGAPNPQSKEYNQSINLSSLIPEKEGYVFVGWNTNKDGTGTSYAPNGVYSTNANLMLYAQWEEIVYSTGDVDRDGEIGLKDVVQITRYLAGGWDVTVDLTLADINKDGEVNLKDAVLLRRFLAGGWGIQLA